MSIMGNFRKNFMDLESEYLDCGISTLHSCLQSRFSHLSDFQLAATAVKSRQISEISTAGGSLKTSIVESFSQVEHMNIQNDITS